MVKTILCEIQAHGSIIKERCRKKVTVSCAYMGKTVQASGVSGDDGGLWKLAVLPLNSVLWKQFRQVCCF